MKEKNTIDYNFINKYVTDNFIISDDISSMINNFNLLDNVFVECNYIPSNKVLLRLINNNTKFLSVI